jgi:hypothetical protein
MNLTNNQKERIQYSLSLASECFKVFMAAMLLVFVPQYCPETKTTCTFKENFTDLTDSNKAVLGINFITMFLFFILYYVETSRQFYFTKYLDSNNDYPDNHLKTSLQPHPDISNKINEYNLAYIKTVKITFSFFILNTILSAWIIFGYYYDGFRSVTALITNVLLITGKVWNDWNIVNDCITKDCPALSTSLSEPLSYNVLDEKLKHKSTVN